MRYSGFHVFVPLVLAAVAAHGAGIASHTLLLDGAIAGNAVIAVGERGTILRSTDQARSWSVVHGRLSAALTGISFGDGQHGWAVGHDALILATTDAGATWNTQWQGENREDSFLDVLAIDSRHVIAVGAYGLFMATTDGGRTWAKRTILEDDYHLNRITRGPGGTLYIAGEHGTLLRSNDQGTTWMPIPTEYDGSFFGILPVAERTLLAYGLRGRVFRSSDDGATWSAVPSEEPGLFATAVLLPPGGIALAGGVRALLVSSDGGQTFARRDAGVATAIAELVRLSDGDLLSLGEAGAVRIASRHLLPEPAASRSSNK